MVVSGMPQGDAPSHQPHWDLKPTLALENVVLWLVWKEGVCIGGVMPGKGCSWPIHTQDSCWVCTGTSRRPAGTGAPVPDPSFMWRGCRDCLCETKVHGIHTMRAISSLRGIVRVTSMSQDPKQLKEVPSQGVWGSLGLSVGASGCQGETLHFQTSTHFSHSGFNMLVWPLPLKWTVTVLWPLFPPEFLYEKNLNQDKVWKCTCVLLLGGNSILVKCQTLYNT